MHIVYNLGKASLNFKNVLFKDVTVYFKKTSVATIWENLKHEYAFHS